MQFTSKTKGKSELTLSPEVYRRIPILGVLAIPDKDVMIGIVDASRFREFKSLTGRFVSPNFLLTICGDLIRQAKDNIDHPPVSFPAFFVRCKQLIGGFDTLEEIAHELPCPVLIICYVENDFVKFRFVFTSRTNFVIFFPCRHKKQRSFK